ncbi:MAG TPA: ImmA/IrrE family metallo-endopeptidase [Nitrospirota bacterium]|nr:ImmA/IrrE family metallo-endopeptidase [Nitrospirota bacterium]
MRKLCILFIAIAVIDIVSFAYAWDPPATVREIAVPSLPDIAIISIDTHGPVIYFNPNIIKQTNHDFVTFSRAHEYGHLYLHHLKASFFTSNRYSQAWIQRTKENEADCFAVHELINTEPQAVYAAISLFNAQGKGSADASHPTGFERAANIQICAGITPPRQEYCCDSFSKRKCQITVNAGPIGSPCGCIGVAGIGTTCN